MIAIEIETPIVNHRIDVSSKRLPTNVDQAKIIVMFEDPSTMLRNPDIVALARAARASFPQGGAKQLRADLEVARSEWDGRGYPA